MSYYREQLEEYLKTLNIKADLVCDIGGASNPVKNRVASWEVGEVVYIDNGIEEAKVKHYATDLNHLWPKDDYLFKADVVFCLEVFEYIIDPVSAIKNIASVMKEDATAYITFPFVYPMHQPIKYDYLRYTRSAVDKLLQIAKFKEWVLIPRNDISGMLQGFYRLDGMHPAKGEDHSVTGWIVKAEK